MHFKTEKIPIVGESKSLVSKSDQGQNPKAVLCHTAPKYSPSLQEFVTGKHPELDWCLQVINGFLFMNFSPHLPLWSYIQQTRAHLLFRLQK